MRWHWSKASGAKGAGIGFGNSEIGSSGYGILPYMSAYRENRVYLDISTLENDVEIKTPVKLRFPAVVPLCWLILQPMKVVH